LYASVDELAQRFGARIASARAVIIGSYVPDGIAVLDLVLEQATGVTAFYDIDTPITLAALDTGAADYIAVRQIPRVDLYYSFTGGPTLDRLAGEFGARRPRALYCAVDERRWRPVEAEVRWDFGYLGAAQCRFYGKTAPSPDYHRGSACAGQVEGCVVFPPAGRSPAQRAAGGCPRTGRFKFSIHP
jgi:hypothetical protein